MGKVGTDIQDNRCSWLVVQCLQRASPEQCQVLQESRGQKEAEKVDPGEGASRGDESAGCVHTVQGGQLQLPYGSHGAVCCAPVPSHHPGAGTQDLRAEKVT